MKRKMDLHLILVFLAALIPAILLSACGNAKKEAGEELAAGVPTIGFTECYNCHADANNPASFSSAFGDSGVVNPTATRDAVGWINSPHANNESWDGANFVKTYTASMNTGFPYYGYEGLGTDPNCTTACHDPLGEGMTISEYFIETGNALLGRVDRPVIGCEACHGGGGNHWGVGPLPYAKPGPSRCGQCHNDTFSDQHNHTAFHPEGDSIIEDYNVSSHASSTNEHVYVEGSTTDVSARCSRCHTDEGARNYVPVTSGTATYNDLINAMNNMPNVANASAVQCRTCHNAHNPLRLLGELDGVAPGAWSDEFKTCTSCHQLLKATGSLNDQAYHTPYDTAGNVVNSFGSVEEIIPDTHYDSSTTPQLTGGADTDFVADTGGIEGYVIVPSATHSTATGTANTNTGICRDCHNPHKADTTINKQWARSAHGGHILEKKEAASNVYTAAVLDGDAPGWIHYNWKRTGRAACQRCHTSTGFRNFANNQAAYDADGNTTPDTSNDFSHLSGGQAELLYCWACHTDNIGTMRNPGQISANYNAFIGSGTTSTLAASVTYTYPDVSKSNVCMGCHTGRENGDSIAQLNTQPTPTTANFSNLGFINSHYLTAGGTVFTATGYEYASRDYASPSSYMHDKIGSSAAANTGTSGPCAGCHMSTPESHLFLPVTRDANETITAVTSTVCAVCHPSGEALTVDATMLENQKTLLADSLEALLRQLDARGYYFRSSHPYFFRPRVTTGTVSVTNGSATVTGTGTSWSTAGIVTTGSNPDRFKVNLDGTYYVVAAVVSDTELTLTTAYAGTTVANASYSIIRSGSTSGGVTNWLTSGDADTTGAVTGKNNMGAAFNLNLLEHDPGAFAHNRYYAKRLVYDAIDWADDNNMNYSVGATLNALDATEHPYKADAISYILVNGTATGASTERP